MVEYVYLHLVDLFNAPSTVYTSPTDPKKVLSVTFHATTSLQVGPRIQF